MYGQGRHLAVAATISTDNTFSTFVNITGANKIALEIPTFAVGASTDSCNVYAMVCQTETGTYRVVKDMGVYSSVSGIQDWEVPRSIGNYVVNCPVAVGFNYLKIGIGQAGQNKTATANILCKIHVIN
jgi:hypothetical protein